MFDEGANFVMRSEPYVGMMRFDIFVNSNEFTYEADFSKEGEFNEITSMSVPNYVQVEMKKYILKYIYSIFTDRGRYCSA